MRFLYRLLVYALVTAIIEGSSGIALYSSGYPNNRSSMGSLAFPIFFNVVIWMLIGNTIGGPEAGAPPGSWIYNPLFQIMGGIIGMFIIVAVIGEGIVWLSRGMGKHK